MKFCLYVGICCCLIYYSVATCTNPALEVLGAGEYCIYSKEEVNCELVTKINSTGFGFIYYCDSGSVAHVRAKFTTIDGESIKIYRTSAEDVLEQLRYRKVSQSHDTVMSITYAYSPRGNDYITMGGKKINLQIAQRGNVVVVGWPVILGSY